MKTQYHYIGQVGFPIVVNAGNVIASVVPPPDARRAEDPNIVITAQGAATFSATTGSGIGSLTGNIDLRTLAGKLTVGGATNTDAAGTIHLSGAAGVTVSAALGDANTNGNITIDGNSGDIVFTSDLNVGNYTVTLNESGFAELGPNTSVIGTLAAANGVEVGANETLGGTGNVNGPVKVLSGGKVSPGINAPGALTVGGLHLASGAQLFAQLAGIGNFDQVIVNSGTIQLGGATLALSLDAPLAVGDTFMLIRNDTGSPVQGQFADGATFSIGDNNFSINYAGGDGNDVVLRLESITTANVPPTITITAAQNVNEDTALVLSAANSNAITLADPDAGATNLSIVLKATNGTATLASTSGLTVNGNGTASVTFSGTLASITAALNGLQFTPAGNFDGSASLKIDVTDAANATDSKTLAINVASINDAPTFSIAANPPAIAASAGPQTVNAFAAAIAAGPSDESSQTVSFQVTMTGSTGNLAFSTAPAISSSGVLTYTAQSATTGTATFNVVLMDSGASTSPNVNASVTRTFTITVNAATPVNQAPVNTLPDTPSTNEDTNLTLGGITIADPDAGAASVRTTVSIPANSGVLNLTAQGGATLTSNNSISVRIDGTLAAINATLATLVYQPAGNFNGPVTLTVLTDDLGNTGTGGALTDSDTLTINVAAINDAPSFTIVGNPAAVNEDAAAQSVSNFATSISAGPADEAAQTLTFNVVVTGTTGNLAFTSPPAISSSGVLTYTLAPNTNGTANISVTLTDSGTNAAPNVNTSAAQTFTLTANAVNDEPTFALAGNPPASNQDTGPQTVASFATNIARGPSDEASQTLTFTLQTTGSTGSLVFDSAPAIDPATGALSYTAAPGTSGTATISVVLTDSGSNIAPNDNTSAAQTFTITVNAVVPPNQPPVNTVPSLVSTLKNTALALSGAQRISIADPDAGASDVQVTLALSAATAGKLSVTALAGVAITGNNTATVTLTGSLANLNTVLGSLVYTPANNFTGSASLTVITSDLGNTGTGGAKTDSDTIAIQVDAPPPPASPVYMDGDTLVVEGTHSSDRIIVQPGSAGIAVRFNNKLYSGFSPSLILIHGNEANDNITVTGSVPIPLEVYGDGGNDYIAGGIAADFLDGGEGADRLLGGGGDDELHGGAGKDTLSGGLGNDLLFGDEDADNLSGDNGDDIIDAGDGNDTANGGVGNDLLRGQAGSDRLSGGAGDDILAGGDGSDQLRGEAGQDLLIGGAQADTIYGGAGADLLLGDGFSLADDDAALQLVLLNWTLGGDLDDRAATAESDLSGLIDADSANDTLYGEGDSDLFTLLAGEILRDLKSADKKLTLT